MLQSVACGPNETANGAASCSRKEKPQIKRHRLRLHEKHPRQPAYQIRDDLAGRERPTQPRFISGRIWSRLDRGHFYYLAQLWPDNYRDAVELGCPPSADRVHPV